MAKLYTEVFHLRMSETDREMLKQIAQAAARSESDVLRMLIRTLAQHPKMLAEVSMRSILDSQRD